MNLLITESVKKLLDKCWENPGKFRFLKTGEILGFFSRHTASVRQYIWASVGGFVHALAKKINSAREGTPGRSVTGQPSTQISCVNNGRGEAL